MRSIHAQLIYEINRHLKVAEAQRDELLLLYEGQEFPSEMMDDLKKLNSTIQSFKKHLEILRES